MSEISYIFTFNIQTKQLLRERVYRALVFDLNILWQNVQPHLKKTLYENTNYFMKPFLFIINRVKRRIIYMLVFISMQLLVTLP